MRSSEDTKKPGTTTPARGGSRFASLLSDAQRARADAAADDTAEASDAATPPAPPTTTAAAPPQQQQERRGPGRPRSGKRSDPDYTQVTAYVRAATYKRVKMALMAEDRGREFSDLVETLLTGWLADPRPDSGDSHPPDSHPAR
ncbi:MAG TPA: hypothetical protein VM490_17025 [Armatimonadaceae bacterium]|nr:hypothetical protein [Armatimonadaceae bacterium]